LLDNQIGRISNSVGIAPDQPRTGVLGKRITIKPEIQSGRPFEKNINKKQKKTVNGIIYGSFLTSFYIIN
jgi:hypothetical protein